MIYISNELRYARFTRKVIIEIGNRIVLRSPVGNPDLWISAAPPGYAGGAFRANWQYGFNSDPQGNLADIDGTGSVSINRITLGVMSASMGGVHFIVNNMPYGEALENGHSSQAPLGMVGLTELEFPEIVARAKL